MCKHNPQLATQSWASPLPVGGPPQILRKDPAGWQSSSPGGEAARARNSRVRLAESGSNPVIGGSGRRRGVWHYHFSRWYFRFAALSLLRDIVAPGSTPVRPQKEQRRPGAPGRGSTAAPSPTSAASGAQSEWAWGSGCRGGTFLDRSRRAPVAGYPARAGFKVLTGISVIRERTRIPGGVFGDGMVAPASCALVVKKKNVLWNRILRPSPAENTAFTLIFLSPESCFLLSAESFHLPCATRREPLYARTLCMQTQQSWHLTCCV